MNLLANKVAIITGPGWTGEFTKAGLDISVLPVPSAGGQPAAPTEAAIDVTAHTVTDADRIIPIGAPVWNTRIYVVDRYGQPVPPGVPGTLLIAGCQVALSYVGQPELTAQRFRPDPDYPGEQIYDSGDRALWHGGELYYLGRSDGQVKLRGQRLELCEV